jgi:hypothetical protein
MSALRKIVRFTQSNNLPVGMVIQSMLTEAQFQELNGPGWILADGRSVVGSVYASVTGNTTIPDARGLVLRGKNNGRSDGNQDPAGERALGNFQTHAFGSHTHTQNAHAHGASVYAGGGGATTQFSAQASNGSFIGTANTNNATPTNQNSGDSETRMRNLAVNTFIKINP